MATKTTTSPIQALVPMLLAMTPDEAQTVVDLLQGIVDHRREGWMKTQAQLKKALLADAAAQAQQAKPLKVATPVVPTPRPARKRGRPTRLKVTPVASGPVAVPAAAPEKRKRGRPARSKPTGAMPPLGTAPTSHEVDVPLAFGGEDLPDQLPPQAPTGEVGGRPAIE